MVFERKQPGFIAEVTVSALRAAELEADGRLGHRGIVNVLALLVDATRTICATDDEAGLADSRRLLLDATTDVLQ